MKSIGRNMQINFIGSLRSRTILKKSEINLKSEKKPIGLQKIKNISSTYVKNITLSWKYLKPQKNQPTSQSLYDDSQSQNIIHKLLPNYIQ